MMRGPVLENLTAAIVDECRSGLDVDTLRASVLPRLRRAVPIDALWWASVDPATLLFTQAYRQQIPAETGPYFVENEFLQDDVNKWTELARDRDGVRTLVESTGGEVAKSPRYLDIFRPLGLEDELRAVLRSRGACWGYLCLHREAGQPFTREETRFVGRLAPHLAEGIRLGLLLCSLELSAAADAPGLVLVASDGSVSATNEAAGGWLEELGGTASGSGGPLPIEVYAVAAKLRALDRSQPSLPRLRVRTRAGRFALVHASWLSQQDAGTIAVIIEEAHPLEIAPVIMAAYGLTPRERTLTGLVCQGLSTAEIASRLHLSTHTVQDHLKSIFDKTGVRSRRELVVTVLKREYLPRTHAGQPVGSSGFYV